jgi:membrane protease YdiL (CAAX protease family)
MTAETIRPVIRVSVFAIIVFQVCGLFARSALDLALVRSGTNRAVANDLSYLVVPPLLIFFLYPYLRQHRDTLVGLLRPAQLSARLCCLSLLLGVLMRVTYMAILTVLMWAGFVRNDDPDAIAGPIIGFGCPPLLVLSLSLFVVSFLVPFVEEVINRGLLLHALLPRGVVTSVVVSAGLFAAMHEPGTYPGAFVSGLFFGVQMLNARTLWAPLLTHSAYNATATISWDCTQIIWNPPQEDAVLGAVTQVAVPLATLGVLVCCLLVSKKAIGAR